MPTPWHKHFRQRRWWPLPLCPCCHGCSVAAFAVVPYGCFYVKALISSVHEAWTASPAAVLAGCGVNKVVIISVLVPMAAALRHLLSSCSTQEHQSNAHKTGYTSQAAMPVGCGANNVAFSRVLVPTSLVLWHPLSSAQHGSISLARAKLLILRTSPQTRRPGIGVGVGDVVVLTLVCRSHQSINGPLLLSSSIYTDGSVQRRGRYG